jgi:hypothetical protein
MDSYSDDWRYDRLKWLQGCSFRLLTYHAPSEEWDHDHCAGCWAKFADLEGPDILHEGFVYAKPHEVRPTPEFIEECIKEGMHCIQMPAVQGEDLHWVCPECFAEFQGVLDLKVTP